MNASRTLSHAEALGIIKGALWSLGCDPAPVVWAQVSRKLSATRDPVKLARLTVEHLSSSREGARVWDVFESLSNAKEVLP